MKQNFTKVFTIYCLLLFGKAIYGCNIMAFVIAIFVIYS